MNIVVPRELTTNNLSRFLSNNNNILINNLQRDNIILDMRRCRWITPAGVVTLISFMRYLIEQEKSEEFGIIRPRKEDLDIYLNRIDFYENLGLDLEKGIRRNSSGRFRELINIDSHEKVRDVSTDLIEIIENKTSVSEKMKDNLHACLGEVLENIFHHSYSPINGYVCAQSYSNKRKVEFAIADAGIGIRNSLKKNPDYSEVQEDPKAISLALQKGVTGNVEEQAATGLSNTGEGLHFIKEAIIKNKGKLLIHSGKGMMVLDNTNPTFDKAPYWQGTIVSLIINLDYDLSLYEKIDDEIEGTEEDWDMFDIEF